MERCNSKDAVFDEMQFSRVETLEGMQFLKGGNFRNVATLEAVQLSKHYNSQRRKAILKRCNSGRIATLDIL